MEDMTNMANKAIQYSHGKKCRCEECLTKAARAKITERERRTKEAARVSKSVASGPPRYGEATFR